MGVSTTGRLSPWARLWPGVTPFASTAAVDVAAPSPKQTLCVVLVELEASWLVGRVSLLPGGCLPGSLDPAGQVGL